MTSRLDNEITPCTRTWTASWTYTLAGRSAVLDGELVVLGSDGRPDFHGRRRRHTAQTRLTQTVLAGALPTASALGWVPAVAEPETREPLHC